MRMRLAIERGLGATPFPTRDATPSDTHQIGQLMLDSYRDTVDYEGETLDDAVAEVERVFADEYGRLVPRASAVIETEGRPVAACLVTILNDAGPPFVCYTMTHPRHRRQGMVKYLIRRVADALLDLGHTELVLAVTVANQPALQLYGKLGFQEVTATQ